MPYQVDHGGNPIQRKGPQPSVGLSPLTYHMCNTNGLSTSDNVASLGGLIAFVAFAAAIFTVARHPRPSPTPMHQ